MFNKKLSMLVVCFSLLLVALFPAVAGASKNTLFVDVNNNHWAKEAIYSLAANGIINGYPDKSFKPDKTITREEFAKLIATTFNLNLSEVPTPTFFDVEPDSWSFKYIEASKEFLTGYYPSTGNPFYDPTAPATREDVAAALVKVLGFQKTDLEEPYILDDKFYDAHEISYNLREYVAIAAEKGLITGYPDTTFRPNQPITRAEASALLLRTIRGDVGDETIPPVLKVKVPEETSTAAIYISGITNAKAKVTINDRSIEVLNGEFRQAYEFLEEGIYEFEITATIPGGKTLSIIEQVTYKIAEGQ